MTFSSKTRNFLKDQILEWDLAANNYKDLKKVKTRKIYLPGGSTIKVQFNPGRILSSSAKVDTKSIQERPCFLCEKNRPEQQRGLSFQDEYTVLVNPFPIFPEHLTIPLNKHADQLIEKRFDAMLNLAKELDDFTIFYNGPKCGASAPDHFHFQAGNKGFMPIESDYRNGKFTELLGEKEGVQLLNWHNYNRSIITLDSESIHGLLEVFKSIYKLLWKSQSTNTEPMLNILAYSENNRIIVHLFPRILHRPDCYFAKDEKQILISPASVDLGGVFITPRIEDFEKITNEDIAAILDEVCLDELSCKNIIETILKER